ncbi:hypothetical protein M1N24_01630 [Dehalococcoidia bacterium]|nr:hypothetical protein [Dehalococcoidia bacterium]
MGLASLGGVSDFEVEGALSEVAVSVEEALSEVAVSVEGALSEVVVSLELSGGL